MKNKCRFECMDVITLSWSASLWVLNFVQVFHFRSWTSAKVMTTGQRAELLKRVAKDGAKKRLSFNECEKIAEDLNLTLEQVG